MPKRVEGGGTLPDEYRGQPKSRGKVGGRIKALLLRRQNDYFGDAFGHASSALRHAAAAAAIDGCNKKQKIHNFFIAPSSIAAIIN